MTRLKAAASRILPDSALQAIRKLHYARVLRRFEIAEEPELVVVSHLVGRGDRAIDLGANIGVYTLFLSRAIGDTGMVCAVEPVPPTHEILASNVKKLGLRNTRLIQCAVSREEGVATMEIPHFEWGSENLYQSQIVGSGQISGRRSFTVPTRTVDSIYEEIGSPLTFVKCDVEGHELPSLEGAQKLLSRERPAWLIEVSSDPDPADSDAHRLFDLLQASGYRAYRWDGTKLIPRRFGDRSVNYFFLTPTHADLLRNRGLTVDPV